MKSSKRGVYGAPRVCAALLAGAAAVLCPTFDARPGTSEDHALGPVAGVLPAPTDVAARSKVDSALQKLPLYFVENRGQTDPRVRFYLQGRDTAVYFTDDGVTFALTENAESQSTKESLEGLTSVIPGKRWAVKLDFLAANPQARPRGEHKTGAMVSYFRGAQADWKTAIPTYTGVSYRDLWPGIDLVYTGNETRLKYVFVVEPGADPSRIRLAYRGATSVRLTEEGRLAVSTPMGEFEDDRPYAYQEIEGERTEVPAEYGLEEASADETRYGFSLGPYDKTKRLILDPVFISYSGYVGGSSTDSGNNIAVDGSGNAYITGWTLSDQTSFPETVGPGLTHNGSYDAFVAKVNASGTALLYCGYIGGSGSDFGNRIAVDASGSAYISGETTSTDLPVLGGPDLTHGGTNAWDGFVAKVKADGTGLDYCGYIGGSGEDRGGGIDVDGSGNAYVTGRTASIPPGFPVTGGLDGTYNGGTFDAFVAKINSGGSFVYLEYIGGSGQDLGVGLAVDSSDSAYVIGTTDSGDFPVSGGLGGTPGGLEDAFVAKVNSTGTSLVYSGYIGGSAADEGFDAAVDSSGNAYLSGRTASNETTDGFPVTVGPDLDYNGGTWDAFVAKVKSDGSGLDYCGYIGGSGSELSANGIAVDGSGNAYMVGYTSSTEASFPVIRGPLLTFSGGTYDAFVAKVESDGSGLSYCGYIGGANNDYGNGIAVDSAGNAYVAGQTYSDPISGFPLREGPDLSFKGVADAWVTKIGDTGGTAVELITLGATGYDGAVRIEWETATELDNLGFHLHRSLSEHGPYVRITPSLIPGLGSSPEGARYHYLDTGLVNGTTYFYKLEDIETTGKSETHGPVRATPVAGGVLMEEEGDSVPARLTYGDPRAVSMRVVKRAPVGAVLELHTGGFIAEPLADGSVRLTVPGLWNEPESDSPAIPVWRSWLEVPPGRSPRIVSVREEDLEAFTSLRPAVGEALELTATDRGVLRLTRRSTTKSSTSRPSPQKEAARILDVGYQGEIKKALVEISPLRWDGEKRELLLARRLIVRLSFSGRERMERPGDQTRDRQQRRSPAHRHQAIFARFRVRDKGLYAVRFEEVMGPSRLPLAASSLGLKRLGQTVPFHLEPGGELFGPGSVLYFFTEGAALNPYGNELVYELVRGEGESMSVHRASPWGERVGFHWQSLSREENRYYQPALLEAPDIWLWDALFAPMRKSYPFELTDPVTSSAAAQLEIGLQGASELSPLPDHHIRVYLNGAWVGETSFAGKKAEKLAAEVPLHLLREGTNQLEIENIGDSGAPYSMVMLDRFTVSYPRRLIVGRGFWEGSFSESGVAELIGLDKGAFVLDITESPKWLKIETSSFRVEAGRKYVAVNPSSVLRPMIDRPRESRLNAPDRGADYLIVAPRAFLSAAQPLLDWRRRQGLRSHAVSIEDIYSEFGFGESRPEALKEFLAHAYHHWEKPSLRYVLLLGDGSYDFKDYLGTGVQNQVPPWIVKTSFLWTASDSGYAAVNGEDLLPDLAIGRLPAAGAQEARILVGKILAYEISAGISRGPVVLVADNPDPAGDFVGNAEELASGPLASSNPQRIYLDRLGTEGTRAAIAGAFDRGASLLSYIGHGGIQLWAQENIFDNGRVGALLPQEQQPVVLTLNCLNGYFHFPYFNSLSEELLKAENKGAIAAISPSGLSLDAPAHLFHRALLRELLSSANTRVGDAFLAAQTVYAETGAFPELLTIYHLLGDPALRIR